MANNSNFQVAQQDEFVCEAPNNQVAKESTLSNLKYMVIGIAFGIVFVKAEIISWFRIQEMFRMTSFHMYGVIGTAVVVGVISVFLIKKLGIKTLAGEEIKIAPKTFAKGQIYGGLLFGFGVQDRFLLKLAAGLAWWL
jgi:uncharacterized protein